MAREDELGGEGRRDEGLLVRNGGQRCMECPLERLPGLHQPLTDVRRWISAFREGEMRFTRGDLIWAQGTRPPYLFTILSGVLMRTRLLEDGRRQIVNFMFPGDFVGLQGALDGEMSHSVEAMTSATLCAFARGRFFELASQQPQLSFDLTWLAAHEEAALEEHIVSLGQRNARERMVALAVFLVQRGIDTGLAPSGVLQLTVTQSQIADMLGLSLVHTNRSLQALRRLGLVDWTLTAISIPDMTEARRFARLDTPPPVTRPYI